MAVYNTSNSELPHNEVRAVTVNSKGRIWAGTAGGAAIFDGTNWTVYNTSNSNLPHNHIWSFAEDQVKIMWVATSGGLAKSDDASWQYFNTVNSDLPDNRVTAILIDNNGNKWIGTDKGVAVFNETGIVSVDEIVSNIPIEFRLEQNYPNPFNPGTSINYQIPITSNVSLKVYDLLGKEVATLVNENKSAGIYSVRFKTTKFGLSSGIYFYKLKTSNYIQARKMVLLK